MAASSTPLPSRCRRFLVLTGHTEALYVTLSGKALVKELKGE